MIHRPALVSYLPQISILAAAGPMGHRYLPGSLLRNGTCSPRHQVFPDMSSRPCHNWPATSSQERRRQSHGQQRHPARARPGTAAQVSKAPLLLYASRWISARHRIYCPSASVQGHFSIHRPSTLQSRGTEYSYCCNAMCFHFCPTCSRISPTRPLWWSASALSVIRQMPALPCPMLTLLQ